MGSRDRRIRRLTGIRDQAAGGAATAGDTVSRLLDRTAAALHELEDLEAEGIKDPHLRRCVAYLLGNLDEDLSPPERVGRSRATPHGPGSGGAGRREA